MYLAGMFGYDEIGQLIMANADPAKTIDKPKHVLGFRGEDKPPKSPNLRINSYYSEVNIHVPWGQYVKLSFGQVLHSKENEPLPEPIRHIMWKCAATTKVMPWHNAVHMNDDISMYLKAAQREGIQPFVAAVVIIAFICRNYSFDPALLPHENYKASADLIEPMFKEAKLSGASRNHILNMLRGNVGTPPAFKTSYHDISNLYAIKTNTVTNEVFYRSQHDNVPSHLWNRWRIENLKAMLGKDPLRMDNEIFLLSYLDNRYGALAYFHINNLLEGYEKKVQAGDPLAKPETAEEKRNREAQEELNEVDYFMGF